MKNTFALLTAKLAKWSFLLKRVSSPNCTSVHHIIINTHDNDAMQPFASFLFSEGEAKPAVNDQPTATNSDQEKEKNGTTVNDSMQWKRRMDDDLAYYNPSVNNYKTKAQNNDAMRPFASLYFFALTKNFNMKRFVRRSGAIAMTLLIANLFFTSNAFSQSQTFNYTGSNQTFTVPAGVTSITVEAWGAGGAGGGLGSSTNARAGGGGGAYIKGTITTSPGTNYTVVIGQGATSSAGSGTATTFGGASLFSAAFGTGGASSGDTPGLGGTAAGSTVTASATAVVKTSGANGANRSNPNGGKGGDGGNAVGTGGAGGTAGNNGTAGTAPGGGGGGAGTTTGTNNGGNGGNGRVIVTWTIPCPTIAATATKNDISCFNINTGEIIVSVPGAGTAPFQYSIDNGVHYFSASGNLGYISGASFDATLHKFSNLPANTYQVRIKDANGCESKSVQ